MSLTLIKPVRAVIFDRNQVLLDFDWEVAASFFEPLLPISLNQLGDRWLEWADKVGFPASIAAEKKFWHGFWLQLGDELNLGPVTRFKLLQFDYTCVFRPYPDARPALEAARHQGLRIGVLSNFSLTTLDRSLAAVGLDDLVDVACGSMVIGVAKPEPEAYLHITRLLHVSPDECLFFDNKPSHVAGARILGMHAYLVDRHRSSHDLAQQIVPDLSLLPTILNSSPSASMKPTSSSTWAK